MRERERARRQREIWIERGGERERDIGVEIERGGK